MKLFIISKKTARLKQIEIQQICSLKNAFWKFGIHSQRIWFKKNVKKNFIHNIVKINNEILAYTMLRDYTCHINKVKKKYYLFDTLIVKKKYRKSSITKKIMKLNSKIIKQKKVHSLLFCNKKKKEFYEIYKWKELSKKNYKIHNFKTKKTLMIFNYLIKKGDKIEYKLK